jgi:hypothetical protein
MTQALDFESQELQVHYVAFNLRTGKNKYTKIALLSSKSLLLHLLFSI